MQRNAAQVGLYIVIIKQISFTIKMRNWLAYQQSNFNAITSICYICIGN